MHSCFHVRNFSFEKFEFDEKFNLEKPRAAQNCPLYIQLSGILFTDAMTIISHRKPTPKI